MNRSIPPSAPPSEAPEGERVAKRLARAGVASRREAERLILEGRVRLNGRLLETPAVVVTPRDRLEVDGVPVGEPEPARLWRLHKPKGVLTTAHDDEGRMTIMDLLPPGAPRLMPVGRLDMNSEGLLLLTNDGELKRRLELPSAGLLRRYKVRAHGAPGRETIQPLIEGITVEGVAYQPMIVDLERQQGANVWMTIGLREGKNREIRKALEAVGLVVNRLIRVSYGPFTLGELPPGDIDEISPGQLARHLGIGSTEGWAKPRRPSSSPSVSGRRPPS